MQTTRRNLITGALALGAATTLKSPARAEQAVQPIEPSNSYRYKLGDFEITAVLDFARRVDKPETTFGTNQKPEDVAALLEQNLLPADWMVNMFTPLLVNTGRERILFDSTAPLRVSQIASASGQIELPSKLPSVLLSRAT